MWSERVARLMLKILCTFSFGCFSRLNYYLNGGGLCDNMAIYLDAKK
jgi:hypothetical protein